MSKDEDWNAIEISRQVMRQPIMADIAGDEILPWKDIHLDENIRDDAENAYHPC